tara:strand:- start:662 stop:1495 length:834 start_codon:yes stop_codon:yes gene_type:complete
LRNVTIIGSKGFIGSNLASYLETVGFEVWCPERGTLEIFERNLGVVVFCAGYGRCDLDPMKVLVSNASYLSEVLEKTTFSRLIYLSSTRVYMGTNNSKEDSDILTLTKDSRRLFNLTKLVAEELCSLSSKDVVVVRPSNVYGLALDSPLYLPSIVRNAVRERHVDMYVSKAYEKDYVSVDDVSRLIRQMILKNKLDYRIYNIASGENVSAADIAAVLEKGSGCNVDWHDNVTDDSFPVTSIDRICQEFDFKPRRVMDDLPKMIAEYSKEICEEEKVC